MISNVIREWLKDPKNQEQLKKDADKASKFINDFKYNRMRYRSY